MTKRKIPAITGKCHQISVSDRGAPQGRNFPSYPTQSARKTTTVQANAITGTLRRVGGIAGVSIAIGLVSCDWWNSTFRLCIVLICHYFTFSNIRARAFMAAVPVRKLSSSASRAASRKLGFCPARSTSPCSANVFTIELRSSR